ncbi:MAG TPA: tetratricopeptide repeat protein, partial [Verrucomicrobiae bacterium]|nr:tetratricopeptide repeat protein [Verrucomicrobiae bacterium]
AWFFLILAPSSSFMPTDSPAYEHRMYLSLAAVVVTVVMGIYALAGRRTVAVTVALALVLGVLTWRRNQDYYSEFAIWADAVANRPMNPRAHTYLGKALLDAGKVPEAVGQLDEAIRIKPDYAEPHFYLGNAFLASNKMSEAVGQWEQAIRFKPDHAEARNNLAAALAQAGRLPEAIEQFEQVVRITPDDAEAHYNLGLALQQTGRLEDAIGQYEQALQLRPGYPDAQNNLLRLLARQPGGSAH